ncbi:MAG TPA: GNAT family N-acetyltransferase [Mycobacteriales bacterium]|nr:GNAT family N-acetyltransferase [Mycobacteriales bacterium]
MTTPVLRPIAAEEFPQFYRAIAETFLDDVRESDRESELAVFEPERSLAAFDDKEIVGTTTIISRGMTVPGGELPVAGVTAVSVTPTHRRRGLLTAMMRRQLTELYEQRTEPVAALWASESMIYSRFGYGLAAQGAQLQARTQALTLRPGTDLGGGRVRPATEEEARPHLARVYEAVRLRTPGFLDRCGRWWDQRLRDPEHQREGGAALRLILYEEPSGEVSGYAMYRTKSRWQVSGPDGEIVIRELAAATPQGQAALWSFLLSIDLVREVTRYLGPLDEPLLHLVTDPRAVRLSVMDHLWVRLADVGRALAARRYGRELDVVLDVDDAFCPWNIGRWRLAAGPGGATCERTTDAADLALASTDLGAAYLGGTSLATLAAAGRVRELRPGALEVAGWAFRAERLPWCPEVF